MSCSPDGSDDVVGLSWAYPYPLKDCGSSELNFGSTVMNRPSVGSYGRAPSWVSPVGSLYPPTKPRSVGHAGLAPRTAPNGVVRRWVRDRSLALNVRLLVPCWSLVVQNSPPPVVRTALAP